MEMESFSLKIRHVFGDTSLTEQSIGAGPPVIIQLSGLYSVVECSSDIFHSLKMSLNCFIEFSKNCAGFLWILRWVALWTFLHVELMCFSLCNDSKPPKFGPSEFIQYSVI